LGDYATHSDQTGGFYACNKFEARVRAEGRTEDERVALQVPCFRLCINFFSKKKTKGKNNAQNDKSSNTRALLLSLLAAPFLFLSLALSLKKEAPALAVLRHRRRARSSATRWRSSGT
jgi:hypothetical protein